MPHVASPSSSNASNPNIASPNAASQPVNKVLMLLVLTAILLLAINMRAPIIGFGAVAQLIQADLHLTTKTIGIIGTIPVMAFALSSFIAPKISAKLGLETTMLLASFGMALGIFLRVWQPQLGFLWVGTVVLSLAISLGNVLVPAVIKKFLPNHISQVMSVYSLTLSMLAGLAAGSAMWLTGLKNWQFALGVWGWISVLAGVAWMAVKFSIRHTRLNDSGANANPEAMAQPTATNIPYPSVWRMPMAWFISAFMGIQSLLYYTLASFLPSLLMAKGLSVAQVSTVGMFFQMMAFPSIMLLSFWVARGGSLRVIGMGGAIGNFIGVLGFGFLSVKWAWLWAICAGFGCGVIFTLCLLIFTIKARDSTQAAQLSGMANSVGYGIAVLGPLLTGWLKDLSQGWQLPMTVLLGLMVVKCAVAWLATQDKPLEAVS